MSFLWKSPRKIHCSDVPEHRLPFLPYSGFLPRSAPRSRYMGRHKIYAVYGISLRDSARTRGCLMSSLLLWEPSNDRALSSFAMPASTILKFHFGTRPMGLSFSVQINASCIFENAKEHFPRFSGPLPLSFPPEEKCRPLIPFLPFYPLL